MDKTYKKESLLSNDFSLLVTLGVWSFTGQMRRTDCGVNEVSRETEPPWKLIPALGNQCQEKLRAKENHDHQILSSEPLPLGITASFLLQVTVTLSPSPFFLLSHFLGLLLTLWVTDGGKWNLFKRHLVLAGCEGRGETSWKWGIDTSALSLAQCHVSSPQRVLPVSFRCDPERLLLILACASTALQNLLCHNLPTPLTLLIYLPLLCSFNYLCLGWHWGKTIIFSINSQSVCYLGCRTKPLRWPLYPTCYPLLWISPAGDGAPLSLPALWDIPADNCFVSALKRMYSDFCRKPLHLCCYVTILILQYPLGLLVY